MAMRESASRGFYPGGTVPFGYKRVRVQDGKKERSKLVPDLLCGPTVVRLFKECLLGNGLREIAIKVNADGIPAPRGGIWESTRVHRLLTNEAYTGTMVFDRERPGRPNQHGQPPVRVENARPPLVDHETFSVVQSLLRQRAPRVTHPRTASSPYLLSSLLRCAQCGRGMTGHSVKQGAYRYYVCSTADKTSKKACGPGLLPKNAMEGFILDRVRTHILTEENLATLVELVQEEIKAIVSQHDQRGEALTAQLTDIDGRLDNLYGAVETGKLTLDDLAPRIKDLRSQQAQAQRSLADLVPTEESKRTLATELATVRSHVQQLQNVLERASLGERRSFLRSFVASIDVWPQKVLLRYTLPLLPKGTKQESIRGLSTILNGTPGRTRTAAPGSGGQCSIR